MKKQIKQTWFFEQTPDEVWEYLTKPELIELWLMKTDFQPIAGHKFQFSHTVENKSIYNGLTHGEVLEVVPFARLSYSWNGSTKDGSRKFTSKVQWTLVPKENGTELQLEHDGFELTEDIFNHDRGWNVCVSRLEALINTPK